VGGKGPCVASADALAGDDEASSLSSTVLIASAIAIVLVLLVVCVVIVRQRRHIKRVEQQHMERMQQLRQDVHDLFCREFLTGTSQKKALDTYAKLEVSRNDIDLSSGTKLGNGAFGTVMKGVFRDQVVAVKYLSTEHSGDDALQKGFLYETRLMALVQHPSIVRLEAVVTYSTPLLAVLEFMQGGDLHSYLQHHAFDLEVEQALRACIKIAEALEYLSVIGVVHRDLAARNVLVGGSLDVVKLVGVCNGCYF
jgi:heme exporter protein D